MEAWWQRWGRGALTLTRTQRQFKRNPRARKRRTGPLLDFCVQTLERSKRQQITFAEQRKAASGSVWWWWWGLGDDGGWEGCARPLSEEVEQVNMRPPACLILALLVSNILIL